MASTACDKLLQSISTEQESNTFLKFVTSSILSTVTYMRNMFPEELFIDCIVGGHVIKTIKHTISCKDAYLLTRYLKSVFQEIDNQHVFQFIFEILTHDGAPIEFYAVEYDHISDPDTGTKVTGLAEKLLQVINHLASLTKSWGPLPTTHTYQFRLNILNNTEIDHIPLYFSEKAIIDWPNVLDNKVSFIGCLNTTYHSVSITTGSVLSYMDNSINTNILLASRSESEGSPEKNSYYSDVNSITATCGHVSDSDSEPNFNHSLEQFSENDQMSAVSLSPSHSQAESFEMGNDNFQNNNQSDSDCLPPNKLDDATKDLTISLNEPNPSSTSAELEKYYSDEILRDSIPQRCICTQTFDNEDIFMCQYCNYLQHKICYKIWPGSEPDVKCCFFCAKYNSSRTCTDVELFDYPAKQIKVLAVYRRLIYNLQWCHSINAERLKHTFKIDETLVEQFIEKLESEGFIKVSKKNDHEVIRPCLKSVLKTYFLH